MQNFACIGVSMFKGRKNDQQKEIPRKAMKNKSKGRANHSQKCATTMKHRGHFYGE